MILAVDVYYKQHLAVAAGVLFHDWKDAGPVREWVLPMTDFARYQPGEFYRRELPCIMTLLEQLANLPDYIIVDGYVWLDEARRPGMGKYLYDALQGKAAVIGVAKSRFKDSPFHAAVFRAGSKRALYITAEGIDQERAKNLILQMHGRHRLPTLLKRAGQLCRQACPQPGMNPPEERH